MNEFAGVMSKRTDAELIKILNSAPGDYQPAALDAAKSEFDNRGLSHEQITLAEQEIADIQLHVDSKAAEPLRAGWKALCFIIPGIPVLLIAGTLKADGYDRKAKEAFRWTLYGFIFYIGLIIITNILSRIS